MPAKFNNKYRNVSIRLKNWDYGMNAFYFITICTKNREHFFGEILNKEMVLNELGKLAEKYWIEIPIHFPFIELCNFVVMPNHVHGVLFITRNMGSISVEALPSVVPLPSEASLPFVGTLQCNVPTTQTNVPTTTDSIGPTDKSPDTNDRDKNEKMSKISPKPGTISTIMRSYKSVVTKNARDINIDFAWQPLFNDHIIRDAIEFKKIQKYIANNPKNWKDDSLYE